MNVPRSVPPRIPIGAAQDDVGPVAAEHPVVAVAARDRVVARTAGEGVVLVVAVDDVVVGTTVDRIVARLAGQPVVTVIALERVVPRLALEAVVAGITRERVVADPAAGAVVALTAKNLVVARAAADHVVTGPAVERIVAGRGPEQVVAFTALGRNLPLVGVARVGSADREVQDVVPETQLERREAVETQPINAVEREVVDDRIVLVGRVLVAGERRVAVGDQRGDLVATGPPALHRDLLASVGVDEDAPRSQRHIGLERDH